jgi:hypothetical protein
MRMYSDSRRPKTNGPHHTTRLQSRPLKRMEVSPSDCLNCSSRFLQTEKFGQSEFSNMVIRTIRIFQHGNSDNPNFLDRTLVLLGCTLVLRFFVLSTIVSMMLARCRSQHRKDIGDTHSISHRRPPQTTFKDRGA